MHEDAEQIRRTLSEYSHLCDDGRFEELADLFTSDARMLMLDREVEGRQAIADLLAQVLPDGARGVHMTANSLVDVNDSEARVTTDYLFVRPFVEGPKIVAAGRYYDRLRRDEDRWRFSERKITQVAQGGGAGS